MVWSWWPFGLSGDEANCHSAETWATGHSLLKMLRWCGYFGLIGLFEFPCGDGSKPWYLVNPKIAGKWMFIPLKCIYRYWPIPMSFQVMWWNSKTMMLQQRQILSYSLLSGRSLGCFICHDGHDKSCMQNPSLFLGTKLVTSPTTVLATSCTMDCRWRIAWGWMLATRFNLLFRNFKSQWSVASSVTKRWGCADF